MTSRQGWACRAKGFTLATVALMTVTVALAALPAACVAVGTSLAEPHWSGILCPTFDALPLGYCNGTLSALPTTFTVPANVSVAFSVCTGSSRPPSDDDDAAVLVAASEPQPDASAGRINVYFSTASPTPSASNIAARSCVNVSSCCQQFTPVGVGGDSGHTRTVRLHSSEHVDHASSLNDVLVDDDSGGGAFQIRVEPADTGDVGQVSYYFFIGADTDGAQFCGRWDEGSFMGDSNAALTAACLCASVASFFCCQKCVSPTARSRLSAVAKASAAADDARDLALRNTERLPLLVRGVRAGAAAGANRGGRRDGGTAAVPAREPLAVDGSSGSDTRRRRLADQELATSASDARVRLKFSGMKLCGVLVSWFTVATSVASTVAIALAVMRFATVPYVRLVARPCGESSMQACPCDIVDLSLDTVSVLPWSVFFTTSTAPNPRSTLFDADGCSNTVAAVFVRADALQAQGIDVPSVHTIVHREGGDSPQSCLGNATDPIVPGAVLHRVVDAWPDTTALVHWADLHNTSAYEATVRWGPPLTMLQFANRGEYGDSMMTYEVFVAAGGLLVLIAHEVFVLVRQVQRCGRQVRSVWAVVDSQAPRYGWCTKLGHKLLAKLVPSELVRKCVTSFAVIITLVVVMPDTTGAVLTVAEPFTLDDVLSTAMIGFVLVAVLVPVVGLGVVCGALKWAWHTMRGDWWADEKALKPIRFAVVVASSIGAPLAMAFAIELVLFVKVPHLLTLLVAHTCGWLWLDHGLAHHDRDPGLQE